MVECASGLGVHAHETRWSSQAREVGKRIRAGGGGQAKTAVEQLVPDLRGDEVIAVSHDLEVVDLSHRDVDRQLVRNAALYRRDVGIEIERVHISGERALLVSQIEDRRVGGIQTRESGARISRIIRQEEVLAQPELRRVPPQTGVKLLTIRDDEIRR